MNCGPAPNFAGITAWLNTPGGKPLSLSALHGKVVLVDQYWPADYLIDAQGNVRSVHFGEGGYATMGQLIRQLLQAARPHQSVPTPAGVPDKTPTGQMSPETYLGYDELQYLDPAQVVHDTPAAYHFPASLPLGALGLAGTWTDHAEEVTAGPGAELELGFLARDVYLVLGGTGTLDVWIDGRHTQTIVGWVSQSVGARWALVIGGGAVLISGILALPALGRIDRRPAPASAASGTAGPDGNSPAAYDPAPGEHAPDREPGNRPAAISPGTPAG